MDETKKMLIETIVNAINELNQCEAGSEEYEKKLDNLETLYKLKIEEQKNDAEDFREMNSQTIQAEESKRDRWVKIGLESAGIIIPTILYAIFLNRGFEFEEEGVYKSKTFSNLTSRLPRPGKK